MLIECGPRGPVYGRDWRIFIQKNRYPRVLAAVDARPEYLTAAGESLCDVAARWFGCEVDSFGYILNWNEVAHLWGLVDAES